MPKSSLTDFKMKNLKAADKGKRYDVMDADVRGFGVRVNDKRERVFIFYSRFPGNQAPQRRSIGEYPAMTLEDARKKAGNWRDLIKSGIDPKDQEEAARQKVEAEKREREKGAAGRRSKQFERVLVRYIAARRRDGIRKVEEDRNDFKREFLPVWRGMAVGDIRNDDIMAVLKKIKDRGAIRQAINMAQKVGTFFNWCVDDDLIDASPFRAKTVKTKIGKKTPRDRVLKDAEILALWSATDGATRGVGHVEASVYRLLLLTGQRLNDIARASWSEIDLDTKVLTIPAARFKSDRDHTVPLSDDAIAVIEKLPRFPKCNWMFSLNGRRPVTIGTKVKSRLDVAILASLRKLNSDAGLPEWENHDIRRTVRTRLSKLRVMDEIAEAVIGHVPPKIVRNYTLDDRIEDKRDALKRWEGALAQIVGTKSADNVVAIRREIA